MQSILQAIKISLSSGRYQILFTFLALVMFGFFVLVPVFSVSGNTIAIQLDIFTVRDYGIMVLLGTLSSLFITMHIYAAQSNKKAQGVGTAVGGAGGLFAGIAGTAFCASCLAPLFAMFGIGFGGVIFVLEYRFYFAGIIVVLMIISIYLTAQKIHKVY